MAAAGHDLTLVATGRGGLSELFSVDTERTVYDAPQRSLLTVTVFAFYADALFRVPKPAVPGFVISGAGAGRLHPDREVSKQGRRRCGRP